MQQDLKDQLKIRLTRCEGQVRGIVKMLEEDRAAAEILPQLKAVSAAMDGVRTSIIDQELEQMLGNYCNLDRSERDSVQAMLKEALK